VPQADQEPISGVSFLTKSGRPKSRYSPQERLTLLGASEGDLTAFIDLFCPGRPYYSATRPRQADPRAWTTPRGRLPQSEVLRHLCGAMLPGIPPRWVAPRAWEATSWVGIDVDYRGDLEDFRRRCRRVWEAFGVLGIPRRAVLVSVTPSGGRHFRFFTRRKVRVSRVAEVLGRVGLIESPGQIEIFPKLTKGMRLPFGHVPGVPDDPRDWVRFIRRFRRGRFPRVNWLEVVKRAEAFFKVAWESRAPWIFGRSEPGRTDVEAMTVRPRPRAATGTATTVMGVPRSRKQTVAAKTDIPTQRALKLLSESISSPGQAEELWNLGIRAPGTRTTATKQLAWHLLFVKRLAVDEAARTLVDWVYRTGAKTSVDVVEDLARGTRRVEAETRRIVSWMAGKHRRSPSDCRDRSAFSQGELDAIRSRLETAPRDTTLCGVALQVLRYAKLHGQAVVGGWRFQISVNGVIRRWPRCRGRHSRRVMEALIDCGLLTMTRERVRSHDRTGRPRTYLCHVCPALRTGASIPLDEAFTKLLGGRCGQSGATMPASRSGVLRSTYVRSIPHSLERETTESGREAAQGDDHGHEDGREHWEGKEGEEPGRTGRKDEPRSSAVAIGQKPRSSLVASGHTDMSLRESSSRRPWPRTTSAIRAMAQVTIVPMVRSTAGGEGDEGTAKGLALKVRKSEADDDRAGPTNQPPLWRSSHGSVIERRGHGNGRQGEAALGQGGCGRGRLRQSSHEGGGVTDADHAVPAAVPGGGAIVGDGRKPVVLDAAESDAGRFTGTGRVTAILSGTVTADRRRIIHKRPATKGHASHGDASEGDVARRYRSHGIDDS